MEHSVVLQYTVFADFSNFRAVGVRFFRETAAEIRQTFSATGASLRLGKMISEHEYLRKKRPFQAGVRNPAKTVRKTCRNTTVHDQIEIDTLINISFCEKMHIRNMFIYRFLFRFLWIVFRKVVDISPELFYN